MSRFKMRRFEVFVVSGLILGLCFMAYSSFERARKDAEKNRKNTQTCLSNLKQIGMAILQYNRDNDEVYPPANRWSQSLLSYSKSDAIFHCPSVTRFGYSMNSHLNHLHVANVGNPAGTPLVFDSSVLKKFQHDTGTSWPNDARQDNGNFVLFADTHVKQHMQKPLFLSYSPAPRPKPTKKPRMTNR